MKKINQYIYDEVVKRVANKELPKSYLENKTAKKTATKRAAPKKK